jgi:hypothetical protein
MSTIPQRATDTPAIAMGFPSTHWTVVRAPRDKSGCIARGALANLGATCWYPLYAFIRRQGSGPHEAEDRTQEFFSAFWKGTLWKASSQGRREGELAGASLTCLRRMTVVERSLLPLPFSDRTTV